MPPSDAALLAAWDAGDAASGEALFARHFDSVFRFFRLKACDACDELVQRTFVACLEKRAGLRDVSSFRAFLFGIARFELLRHYQRSHRDRVVDLGVTTLLDLDPTPSRVAARNEEQRLLVHALRRIPIDLQIVIELHYWEHLSATEIGDALSIATGTVKSRLRRGRERLEEELRRAPATARAIESTLSRLEAWVGAVREAIGTDPGEPEAR